MDRSKLSDYGKKCQFDVPPSNQSTDTLDHEGEASANGTDPDLDVVKLDVNLSDEDHE